MKKLNNILILILLLIITASCNNEEDEPTNPTANTISKSDLIGTWNLVEVYSEINGVRTAASFDPLSSYDSEYSNERVSKLVFYDGYVNITNKYINYGETTIYTKISNSLYSVSTDGYCNIQEGPSGMYKLNGSKLEIKLMDDDEIPSFFIFVYTKN